MHLPSWALANNFRSHVKVPLVLLWLRREMMMMMEMMMSRTATRTMMEMKEGEMGGKEKKLVRRLSTSWSWRRCCCRTWMYVSWIGEGFFFAGGFWSERSDW